MGEARVELPNGLVIDAENPVMHDHPQYCYKCKTFYYFRHVCPENINFPMKLHDAAKLGLKGYFDGEKNE